MSRYKEHRGNIWGIEYKIVSSPGELWVIFRYIGLSFEASNHKLYLIPTIKITPLFYIDSLKIEFAFLGLSIEIGFRGKNAEQKLQNMFNSDHTTCLED